MLQIKKILCPVDFSDCSLAALNAAIELAETFGASVQVVHVYEVHRYVRPDLTVWTYTGETRPLAELARDQAVSEMDRLAEGYEDSKVELSFRVMEGLPVGTLVDECAKGQYDLMVMGTHGRTGLSHLLMGSVTERVVRAAKCPVLTFKGPDETKTPEWSVAPNRGPD